MVLCTGACVSFWKPLVVHGKPTGKSLPGKLGVAKRPGGARQVTYQGKRLYTFTLDKPGKVTGDGLHGCVRWPQVHLACSPPDRQELVHPAALDHSVPLLIRTGPGDL